MRLTRVLLAIFCAAIVPCSQGNGIKRIVERPKIYGKAIPFRALNTHKPYIRTKIVNSHNFYRSKVRPPAANMLKMSWSKAATFSAKKWADQCVFLRHGGTKTRGFQSSCGQNIFVSSEQTPWTFVVQSWFSEEEDFVYGRINQTAVVGHYTQLVWATSNKVGCGVARCNHKNKNGSKGAVFYNYVCNYCPGGNIQGLTHVPYQKGKSCSKCRHSCFKTKLCTNACHFNDFYSNCAQVNSNSLFPHCEGCEATCKCKRKIYQRYDSLIYH